MSRRRGRDPEPTLFPFLSVLAAVMGTLILIIAGQSQLALANPKQRVEVEPFDPSRKSPIYVECRKEIVVIYPDEPTRGDPMVVARSDLNATGSAWNILTRRLRFDPTRYLLLLVRPDGVGTFTDARVSVSGMDIDLGYEPLFGRGKLRFHQKDRRP